MKKEYDYIVKDYGDHQSGFNEPSYIEQDIKIFVGGVKPNEVFFTYEILKQPESSYLLLTPLLRKMSEQCLIIQKVIGNTTEVVGCILRIMHRNHLSILEYQIRHILIC